QEALDGGLPLALRALVVLPLVPAAPDQTPHRTAHLVEHAEMIIRRHALVVPAVDDEHRASHPRRVHAWRERSEVRDESIPLQVLGPAARVILEAGAHHAAAHRL